MPSQHPPTQLNSQTDDDVHFRVRSEHDRESTPAETVQVDICHWRAAPFDADACPACGYDRARKESYPDRETASATWTCPACGSTPAERY